MHIGILTLFNNGNIGSSLQAYALNHSLNNMGHNCEHIQYIRKDSGLSKVQSICAKLMRLKSKSGRKELFTKIVYYLILKRKRIAREKLIIGFSRKWIPQSSGKYHGAHELESAKLNYDCFICGSDNIWQKNRFDPALFLSFVPDKTLKFSYAAGFSTTYLSKKDEKRFIPLIQRLNAVSVRESFGAEVLRNYISKDIYQHVDPTLLLDCNDWEIIKSPVTNIPPNYIFCYLLGNESESRNFAKQLSKEEQIPIVSLPHATTIQSNDLGFADYEIDKAGPSEFLFLIAGAKYIITDSFHGCIFSIIYHKPFLAFKRFQESNTYEFDLRLESLFSLLKIKSRMGEDSFKDSYATLKTFIDYETVDNNLNVLREEALSYLKLMTNISSK